MSLSQGKVDPYTGEAVKAEDIPAPAGGGTRRSMTQPVSRGSHRQPSPAARPKSATMPMITPGRIWNQHKQQQQQQRQQQQRKTDGEQSLPQHMHKQQQGSRGRVAETPRKRPGGLLAEMFERAASKASAEKENIDPSREASSQDVSDIVLACGPGRTPARGREARPQLPLPAATPNPFAKKSEQTADAISNPRNFVTPSMVPALVNSQCGVAHPPVPEHAAECADAWTRLGKGCLDSVRGDEDSPARRDIVARKRPREEQKGIGAGGNAEGVYILTEVVANSSVKPSGKRSLPTLALDGARSDRGKKASLGVGKSNRPPSAGKGKTMLSFFGRAAAGPKP